MVSVAGQTVLDSTEGKKKRCSMLHKFEEQGHVMRANLANIGESREASSIFEEWFILLQQFFKSEFLLREKLKISKSLMEDNNPACTQICNPGNEERQLSFW